MTSDDRTDGPATWLGMHLSPYVARSLTSGELGDDQLEARYGPVLTSDTVAELFYFKDSTALLASIDRGALPLKKVRAAGRKQVFFSTRYVAWYRAWMASIAPDHDVRKQQA